MRIMVFDVPAESGGALTVLKEYYDAAIKDTINEWIFVLSTPEFSEHKNIKIINYPWIKTSWFHRLFFDHFIAPNLVGKHAIDEVLSLQNLIIPNVKVVQKIYLHQSLPFVDYKFKIYDNPKLWVYQNIYGQLILNSIKKADRIIVQTNWMKKVCIERTKIDNEKMIVKLPSIIIENINYYNKTDLSSNTLFYPAGAEYYKNHRIIVDAMKIMKEKGLEIYSVIFTLNGNENRHIQELYKEIQNLKLNIKFVGKLTIDKVYQYYERSTLIFPSYIETVGLPLLEAKIHKTPIVASDCNFSHEILDDYENVVFFNPLNSEDLVSKLLHEFK